MNLQQKRIMPAWAFFALLGGTALLQGVVFTQSVANAVEYRIGSGRIAGNCYWPWMGWVWLSKYRDTNPAMFQRNLSFSVGAGLATFGLAMLVALRRRSRGIENLHGSARWATGKDCQAAGLFGQDSGVNLGGFKDGGQVRYLVHDGPEHIAVIAPTRSGKGIGVVVPTLHRWTGSAVVLDIKGENWILSAGGRGQMGQRAMYFDPTDTSGCGARYNPLLEISVGSSQEARDCQNIAEIISDGDGSKPADPHWKNTGRSLLVGMLMYELRLAKRERRQPTLAGVDRLMSQFDKEGEFFHLMIEAGQADDGHPTITLTARDMLNRSERERDSVASTAKSWFDLYRDPIVARNTDHSDFRILDLVNGDRPTSLYLVLRPSDMQRLMPLVRMFVTQLVTKLCEKMEFEDGKGRSAHQHRLLLMLDEFPALGKMPIIESGLAYMAGYGIKCVLIMQDMAQLYKAYTKEQAIIGNCHIRVAYAPNNVETAKWLSELAGITTIVRDQVSTSSGGGTSTSVQEVRRQLMTPDEIMQMPGLRKDAKGDVTAPGEVLIFCAGWPPIKGTQTPWFLDPHFKARCAIPPPVNGRSA